MSVVHANWNSSQQINVIARCCWIQCYIIWRVAHNKNQLSAVDVAQINWLDLASMVVATCGVM